MSISKVSKQFFKTFVAIWSIFNRIAFETSFFELLAAVSTDKALGMEFLFHGSYNTSTNSFPARTTLVDFPIYNDKIKLVSLLVKQ